MNLTVEQRLWNKVAKTPDGCWEWTAYRLPKGYGQFSFNGRSIRAHRYSYDRARQRAARKKGE